MKLVSLLFLALRLWWKYGSQIETAAGIWGDLLALDDGHLVDEVEAIFAKHGVDVKQIAASIAAALTAANNGGGSDNGGGSNDNNSGNGGDVFPPAPHPGR